MKRWDITSLLSVEGRTLIRIDLREPIKPIDVLEISKEVEKRVKGLRNFDICIIGGRMPLWLACAITHKLAHIVKIVGIFDPKLLGAVIVSSHSKIAREGELIKLTKDEIEHLL